MCLVIKPLIHFLMTSSIENLLKNKNQTEMSTQIALKCNEMQFNMNLCQRIEEKKILAVFCVTPVNRLLKLDFFPLFITVEVG